MRTITKFEIKKELFICTQVFNLKTRVFFFQKLANIKDKRPGPPWKSEKY
jgi:hypothetical protein